MLKQDVLGADPIPDLGDRYVCDTVSLRGNC